MSKKNASSNAQNLSTAQIGLSTEPSALSTDKQQVFQELSDAVQLREGIDGISKSLWELFKGECHSTRDWARAVHIPVPVLAALRRELEKRDLLVNDRGLKLTEHGAALFQEWFSQTEFTSLTCPACNGFGKTFPVEALALVDAFRPIAQKRPSVDVTLDQSHATAESAMRKALLLFENGHLNGSIIFMGDDDLISIACWLARKRFMNSSGSLGKLTAADIDERYLAYIDEVAGGEIETVHYDVREALPESLQGNYDCALTDPAYTVNGIAQFALRCRQAVNESATLYLSMPLNDSVTRASIQTHLLQMGWSMRDILPNFNDYHGASIHGHASHLFALENAPPKAIDLPLSPFYTADVK